MSSMDTPSRLEVASSSQRARNAPFTQNYGKPSTDNQSEGTAAQQQQEGDSAQKRSRQLKGQVPYDSRLTWALTTSAPSAHAAYVSRTSSLTRRNSAPQPNCSITFTASSCETGSASQAIIRKRTARKRVQQRIRACTNRAD